MEESLVIKVEEEQDVLKREGVKKTYDLGNYEFDWDFSELDSVCLTYAPEGWIVLVSLDDLNKCYADGGEIILWVNCNNHDEAVIINQDMAIELLQSYQENWEE